MLRIGLPLLVFVGLSLHGMSAAAQAPCKAPSPDCVVVGEWNLSVMLGAGGRSNPVRGAADIPLFVLPQVSYYGERFFLENLDAGFTLLESAAHTINLLATPGYDRVFFVRDDLQNYFVNAASGAVASPAPGDAPLADEYALRARRTTWFTGVEWLFYAGDFTGQVDALYEATGRHKGYEVRTAIAAPLLQSAHSIVLSGGFTWKSAAVVDYYYGVDRLHRPGAAFNPFIKLGYSRVLNERWTLSAFVHYEHLGRGIAASPIVADGGVATAFAGVAWKIL